MAGGFINGWQLSGITQIESGANLSGLDGQNFGMGLNNAVVPGTNFLISNESILGTPDLQLSPLITCNPRSGLVAHQYINPKCFSAPSAVGENGPTVIPPIYGPSFFNTDLGVFKTFRITESKTVQLRFDGYNFLNHPLWSFNGSNLSLSLDPTTLTAFHPDGTTVNNFGSTTTKQGHRIIQMGVKFMF
jgi:hypothetical protein